MDTASDTFRPRVGERSTGDLVKLLSEQVCMLVRDELRLAQLEMTRKGKQAGAGIGMLGSGGLVALYGVGCLLAAAIIAISGAVAAWLAALMVGARCWRWPLQRRCWARDGCTMPSRRSRRRPPATSRPT
jgi:hypothetical protein